MDGTAQFVEDQISSNVSSCENELQLTSPERSKRELTSSTNTDDQCADQTDPTESTKILIDDNSYVVNKNLEPQQKHAATPNYFCPDVSTDAPNYKCHEYFTCTKQKKIGSSSSHEIQDEVTLESSTESDTKEEETICMQENHFGNGIDKSDDDHAYFQCLATILHGISDELLTSVLQGNACVPTANKDLVMIMENLDLPIHIYSEHQDNIKTLKKANLQVKRQYKQLKKVIEKLSEEKSQISCDIPADKFLSKPGFQEYVESREIKSLVQAINKINKSSAKRSQCSVM